MKTSRLKTRILPGSLMIGLALWGTIGSAGTPYVGVGIVLAHGFPNSVVIDEVYPNSPAAVAGIIAGEKLKAVDGQAVSGFRIGKASQLLSGKDGSHVKLTIQNSKKVLQDVDLIRTLVSSPCLIGGAIDMQTDSAGGSQPFHIQGTVGGEFFDWNINGSFVDASVGNQVWPLNYFRNGSQETISGWINNTYISWNGSAGFFSGYQECILNP